jgi:hypothetical protein
VVVKSVAKAKRLEVQVEQGDFLVIVVHGSMGWMLSVEHGGRTIFSATVDTKEAVLRRLDDFIAGLIELSRRVEVTVKKMEDMAESFAKE